MYLENDAGYSSLSLVINVNGVRPTRRQTDAVIDDGGPALEQHCDNVSLRPYSQPRALQCLSMYTHEDNICASACVVRIVSMSYQKSWST